MGAFFYYLAVAVESVFSVFGVRAPYEQPPYVVVGQVADGVELRRYAPRVAVETDIISGDEGAAFGRLFRYITGANGGTSKIAMTVPVEIGGGKVMRFFLPQDVAAAGAPAPTDPAVHIATVPAQTTAVLRFSGILTADSREKHESLLLSEMKDAGRMTTGALSVLSYDPPFAIPFMRRNEIMVELAEDQKR